MAGWQFWVDRGGTFTDIVAINPSGEFITHKLLSVNPAHYQNSAIAGIKAILNSANALINNHLIDSQIIESVKVGTTVATNALLEKKGQKTALVTTLGFADALKIANQNRPDIFALHIQLPDTLFETVIEVDERILVSGEIETKLNQQAVLTQLTQLKQQGYQSLAVVLMHSWKNPQHEQQIAEIARSLNFKQVSLSHQASQTIKLIPRGDTCVADAYLNPVMQDYVNQIAAELNTVPLYFMQSNGGLTLAEQFHGKDAILSGPAGGIVGAVKVSKQAGFNKMIGFDMGGTSTDVSHFAGELERSYHSEIAGIRLATPMMNIHTVAAGGGSICYYQDGRFQVGPESAGAFPGPACYRNQGPLTVTDCNLVLGKLQPELFPAVFGKNADQTLDKQASLSAIEHIQQALKQDGVTLSVADIASGFIKIAVDNMANAIAKISTQRGYDISEYCLTSFGGAGGQHACLIAEELGIKKILIHPYAGVLSAFGIGLAEQTQTDEVSIQLELTPQNLTQLQLKYKTVADKQIAYLTAMDKQAQINSSIKALLKYSGAEVRLEVELADVETMQAEFAQKHLQEFGYLDSRSAILIDSVIVEHSLNIEFNRSDNQLDDTPIITLDSLKTDTLDDVNCYSVDCYLKSDWHQVSVYQSADLLGKVIDGPAIIVEKTGTNLIEPGWQVKLNQFNMLEISQITTAKSDIANKAENKTTSEIKKNLAQPQKLHISPIELEIYNNQFMAIAEQMGLTLAKTAHSVNIRERLDFSCAIFNANAELIANAPHVPVHLGSMSHSVSYLANKVTNMRAGDSYIINSPYAGGTHLPDLTLITPVFTSNSIQPDFYLASRAHHADVGGITPGSMPANSTSILEEGLIFEGEKIAENGSLNTHWIKSFFSQGEYPARNIQQNIADLAAQLAANKWGAEALIKLTQSQGLTYINQVMDAILDNGEQAVINALQKLKSGQYVQQMDNGAVIKVNIQIDLQANQASIDFSGTSEQQNNNFNAPRSITDAAVIYVFRSLVDKAIPLNSGCMRPLKVIVPSGCMLSPEFPAAVVAGNVEVSQAIVSCLLQVLAIQASGQTTMNNVSFGNRDYQYYETLAGGTGAGDYYNGTDAVHSHMTNSRLTDPEILEQRYPVILREFSIRQHSGGTGKFNGGNGLIREIEFLQNMQVNLLTNSRVIEPSGLAGGENGLCGKNVLIKANAQTQVLAPSCRFEVTPKDRFRIETPGGGGFGKSV
ncbi:hydantoinase B/oxoprolinase family protein [Catenovulum sp. 2E275]|uniref:hydantoinase B/oxoprolinase family protein n=1 Tax=Catenovulum sp. 2E275 TaxID=2980497 RepID=UPI0021D268F4|nr:hydantoinase B/oxoprolinase family protein [Catenovulum sp. 2E275]MCU4676977.1 hydantoinase B/oxoprolinase family protein [Catenovulum sp. 2E275]